MSKAKTLLIIGFILSIASVSNADNIVYVDVNGPNDPGTGTFDDPFRRIQDALDVAIDGDIVEIQPGIYTADPNNYNLDPNGKSITIRSTDPNDPNIVANTIIDPGGSGRGFYFHSGEDANCLITGLTIKNASTSDEGAGIYCNNSSPKITNCLVTDNSADLFGGGVSLNDSNSQLIGCTITNNSATDGAGVECYMSENPKLIDCVINNNRASGNGGGIDCIDSNPTIRDCIIKDNVADWYGGALLCASSNPEITGCTISGNSALDGGDLECWSGTAAIQNCVISNNQSDNSLGKGGGIDCYLEGQAELDNCTVVKNSAFCGGGLYCTDDGKATIRNSIFWSNDAPEGAQIAIESPPFSTSQVSIKYSDVQGGQMGVYDPCENLVWGSGNMDADPCFVLFDANGDPDVWDFHLKSRFGRWKPSIYTNLDPSGDGFINLLDFAAFASFWQKQGSIIPADLDNSGLVDLVDLKLLLDNYLASYLPGDWVFDDVTSPCIDAGDPNSDLDGEPWPHGKQINIGAYGGTNEASKNGNVADFDISGVVDFTDLMEFSSKWLDEEGGIVNLDLTGRVDFADFAIFAKNWLWHGP